PPLRRRLRPAGEGSPRRAVLPHLRRRDATQLPRRRPRRPRAGGGGPAGRPGTARRVRGGLRRAGPAAGLRAEEVRPAPAVGGARKKYELRKPSAARRGAWDIALGVAAARLGDLARAFGTLTQQDATDVPAWFNLGLTRAWLGENEAALEALDRYLELEPDEPA